MACALCRSAAILFLFLHCLSLHTVLGLGISDPIIPILLPVQGQCWQRTAEQSRETEKGGAHLGTWQGDSKGRRLKRFLSTFLSFIFFPSYSLFLPTEYTLHDRDSSQADWSQANTLSCLFVYRILLILYISAWQSIALSVLIEPSMGGKDCHWPLPLDIWQSKWSIGPRGS